MFAGWRECRRGAKHLSGDECNVHRTERRHGTPALSVCCRRHAVSRRDCLDRSVRRGGGRGRHRGQSPRSGWWNLAFRSGRARARRIHIEDRIETIDRGGGQRARRGTKRCLRSPGGTRIRFLLGRRHVSQGGSRVFRRRRAGASPDGIARFRCTRNAALAQLFQRPHVVGVGGLQGVHRRTRAHAV